MATYNPNTPVTWNASPALPAGATFAIGTSVGYAQANNCTLAGVTGKTTYCQQIYVTGGGATSASAITVTLSDGTNTLNFMTEVPAGAGVQGPLISLKFDPPLPSATTGATWTLSVPSFGSGNLSASSNIIGYTL